MDIHLHHLLPMVCHQHADRTIAADSTLLPLCARCTGIYASFFFVWLGHIFVSKTSSRVEATCRGGMLAWTLIIGGALLSTAESLSYFVWPLTARLFVGGAMGCGLAILMSSSLKPLVLVAWLALMGVLAITDMRLTYLALSTSSCLGLILLYMVVNANMAILVFNGGGSLREAGIRVKITVLTVALMISEILLLFAIRSGTLPAFKLA